MFGAVLERTQNLHDHSTWFWALATQNISTTMDVRRDDYINSVLSIFSTSPLTHILPTFHKVVHQEYHKATVLLISQKPYIFKKCSALSLCTKKCRMNWESSSLEGFYALVIREDLKSKSYKRMLCWKFPKTRSFFVYVWRRPLV
jgi:hypothetical protein